MDGINEFRSSTNTRGYFDKLDLLMKAINLLLIDNNWSEDKKLVKKE